MPARVQSACTRRRPSSIAADCPPAIGSTVIRAVLGLTDEMAISTGVPPTMQINALSANHGRREHEFRCRPCRSCLMTSRRVGWFIRCYDTPHPEDCAMSIRRFFVALNCLLVIRLVSARAWPPPAGTRMLRSPTVSATHIAFVYANNIWVGRARRRQRAAAHELPGPDDEPAVLARRQVDRVQRRLRRQRRRLRRAGRRRRAEAPDVASRRRQVQGWTPDGKSIVLLRRRARRAAPSGAPRFWTVPAEGGVEEPMALAARLSGKDFARRHAHRLSHEQLVG